MQNAEDDEGKMDSSVQNEEENDQLDGSDEAAEGSREASSLSRELAEGISQDPSAPQPDDLIPQPDDLIPEPDPHLSLAVPPTPQLLSPNTTEDMEDRESSQEEEEEEFIILDSEHSLIKRFQAAQSALFSKMLERSNLELKEKLGIKKTDASNIQDVGVEMFRIQEQLARVQNKLDNSHQTKAHTEAKHQQTQDHLEATESRHAAVNGQSSQANAEVSRLQAELDKFIQHLLITQGHTEELHSKVKTVNMQRNKLAAEKTRAEEKKLKQDLYVKHLTEEVEKLTQQIAMYEVQTTAQAKETRATKEALSEAEMKMELHLIGDKLLMQQWNSSLLTKTREVEASSTMQEMHLVQHKVMLLDKEIESCTKSLRHEEDKNETLDGQLQWSETDCATYEKLINQKRTEQEALQADYSTCLRIHHETEQTLAMLTKETEKYQTELKGQRRQMEKQRAARLELEDKIMTHIQQKLIHINAAKYSQKLTAKKATLKDEKMQRLQQVENGIFSMKLEKHKVNEYVNSLVLIQQALDEEVAKYNKLLVAGQARLSSFVHLIKQKQAIIFTCANKISQIVASTGHEDLSPLQIKLQAITAQMEQLATHIKSDKQLWITQQRTIVGLTQDLEANSREMRKLQMDYIGMEQRKIRLHSQTELEERDQAELESNTKNLKRDIVTLGSLISKNKKLSQALVQENAFMETDFLHKIMEAERKSITMEMNLDETQEEKEKLLNCLMEAEQHIMLWERKIQILRETRSLVDSEIHQTDIKKLRADIHCMELRISQLKKQQEQLMKESEAAVARRGALLLREETMAQRSHRQKTKGELQRSNDSLQHKIKLTLKEVAESEQVFRELQKRQVRVSDSLMEAKQQLEELFCISNTLDSEMVNIQDAKERNMAYLITLQDRNKRLQGVHEGTYKPSSSSETVDAALQRQTESMQAVGNIVHCVCEGFPQHQGALRVVSQALAAHTHTD
ncbi:coiled-coil domain-containing protein 40 [Melanotaenia boesemani]|uniref:coiled-coil domain-containing protein 40 n=1 Tax=Melanotaenia boesemani TaxID=1250792 RepID=UPI001C044143|nr:coiled-coil domain-containing protein 40 [Melanotaenia boesemani]XP_041838286.1 coiled-coil domain-containing protein 40 [Melanotaenia boesemani]